jgi:hypothetical protein
MRQECRIDQLLSGGCRPAAAVGRSARRSRPPTTGENRMKPVHAIALLWPLAAIVQAADFYVAPTGASANSGSLSSPWNLQYAFDGAGGRVRPGDTVWLRGGTYRGTFDNRLRGTAAAPIKVRQQPGERATIDGGDSDSGQILTEWGQYTWFMNFEVMSSNTDRYTALTGSWPNGDEIPRGNLIGIQEVAGSGVGSKFINLVLHNGRQGISFWKEALGAEAYGNIIFFNGWEAPDRLHGHGFYCQNDVDNTHYVTENIVFGNLGYGTQLYGSDTAVLNNFTFDGNVYFNGLDSNVTIGGGSTAKNNKLIGNLIYFPGAYDTSFNMSYNSGTTNTTLKNNYIVGRTILEHNQFAEMSGNTFWGQQLGFAPATYPNNTYYPAASYPTDPPPPASNHVMVRPNRYEAGRANIAIVNWQRLASVSVDVSAAGLAAGDAYVIRDAQDFFGPPVVTGTYTGAAVGIPMGSTALATFYGTISTMPRHSDNRFGAFVLMRTGGGGNALPTVSISSPASGARFIAPATVTIGANAADVDGTISRIEFYQGTTLLGTDTASPYAFSWTNVPAGSYSITAKAIDDLGGARISAAVAIQVAANQLPTVSLTSPIAGARLTAPATVAFAATATDADGTIAKVDFFSGATLLGTDTTSPFGFSWANVAAGSYSLTARATDDRGGARTSAAIAITVDAGAPVSSYYEAESGILVAPMTLVAEAGASGGRFVQSTTTGSGTLRLQVNAPTAGTYVLWGRVLAPTPDTDSLYVSVDGGAEDIWDMAEFLWKPEWQWTRVTGRAANGGTPSRLNQQPRLFTLTAGVHTFTFRGREPQAGLDRLFVTADAGALPAGATAAASAAVRESAAAAADADGAASGRCGLGGGLAVLALCLLAAGRRRG